MAQPSLLVKVTKREPELIKPAQPTAYELKHLSDIDDQEALRSYVPSFLFYRGDKSKKGKDFVKVIREALGKTLVFYYPFAGRLIEGHNRKLIVECNGEGILFLEADADVTLGQLGDLLEPPNFPCLEDHFLFDVPELSGMLNYPLILIQVTRLRCGGFIFSLNLNHTMSDAIGLVQFMKAVGEIASGAQTPSIRPVWERHILTASDPPRVTFTHREYEHMLEDPKVTTNIPLGDLSHRSFSFGPNEICSLRRLVPQHVRNCTTFELLTACIWRCRTIALQPDPSKEMRVMIFVNLRDKFNPPLPKGFYGNVIASPVVVATAGELSRNSVGYAIELVRKAKAEVTEKYIKSVASLMVIKGRPPRTMVMTYIVTDSRRVGFNEVDFGWGKPVYSGMGTSTPVFSRYFAFTNKKGENVIVVPLTLPNPTMERFVKEMDILLTGQIVTSKIMSTL